MNAQLNYIQPLLLFTVFITIAGCSQSKQAPVNTNDETVTGVLQSDQLDELSGVAASKQYPGILYVHNDSGDSSRFFAIHPDGTLLCTYEFKGIGDKDLGVKDCEDIAIGTGPQQGQVYIYLADIGDNSENRSSVQIYRIPEPAIHQGRINTDADVLTLEYPDGPKDAETLLMDPLEKTLYVISKRQDSAAVYSCSSDFQDTDKRQLKLCGKLFLEGNGIDKWVVSGSITTDGSSILLKTVSSVYYWKRQNNEPVYITLQRAPVKQSAYKSNGQEEAISFSPDGKGYYVLAEGKGSRIYYYKLAN